MEDEERERRMGFARQEVATAWCQEKTGDIEMDSRLAEEFAKILYKHMYSPKLGCATTEELIDEIKTRIEMDGMLGYRTIDGEEMSKKKLTREQEELLEEVALEEKRARR